MDDPGTELINLRIFFSHMLLRNVVALSEKREVWALVIY